MTPHRNASSFLAFCVDGDSFSSVPHTVPRPHIDKVLALRSVPGSNIVITGPAGSGKTTTALQLALKAGKTIHYVCARQPRTFSTILTPGHPHGKKFARTLAMLTKSISPMSVEYLESALDALTEIEFNPTEVLILDDLDLIQHSNLTSFIDLIGDRLPKIDIPLIIFVVRQYTDEVRYLVAKRGTALVLPSVSVLIAESELSQMQESQVFGHVPDATIHAAWKETGGWFIGMQHLVNTSGMYSLALEEYVLNDLILTQPQAMQSFYLALGSFPQISSEMIGWIMDQLSSTPDSVSGVLDTIPLTTGTHSHAQGATFAIPATVALCLKTIARRYGHQQSIQAVQRYGIDWFLRHSNYTYAKDLAIAAGQTDYYLKSIHKHCSTLAMTEQWKNIRLLVDGIPDTLLLPHHDFVFWLIMSNKYDGLWPDLIVGRTLILQSWKNDLDPLDRGRALLLEAWEVWAAADDSRIQEIAAESYATLPSTALQERMFAAGTAEIGARIAGDKEAANHWSTVSSKCRLAAPMGPVWWYTYVIFHRASQIAMGGDLSLAQDIARLGLENTVSDLPVAKLPLLLLLTYIALEREDRDQALRLLTEAESRIDSGVAQKMFDLAQTQLHLASGDFKSASLLLRVPGSPTPSAPDLDIHRLRLMARLEMMENRIDLAIHTINQWSESDTNWPRYFGEPSPTLILAMLHAMRGEITHALDLTSTVITEARSRSHLTYALSAYAIEAECYQRLGDAENRDRALAQIAEIDPKRHFMQALKPFGRDVRLLKGTRVHESTPVSLNPRDALDQLTKREIELLEAAASGMKTRQIADQLCIAESTVKNHLSSVYKKLGVRNRKEALMVTYPLRRKDV